MRLYHVSPADNFDSIMSAGLLISPPTRNFNCREQIYATTTLEHARRWAREVARERHQEDDYVIFSFEHLSGYSITENTEIDTPQVTIYCDVAPIHLTLEEKYYAIPQANFARTITYDHHIRQYFCHDCERHMHPGDVQDHIDDWHTDDEDQD